MKMATVFAASALLATMGVAYAAPVTLSPGQMDSVTAGATALGTGGTSTLGDLMSDSGVSLTLDTVAGMSATAKIQTAGMAAVTVYVDPTTGAPGTVFGTPAMSESAGAISVSLP